MAADYAGMDQKMRIHPLLNFMHDIRVEFKQGDRFFKWMNFIPHDQRRNAENIIEIAEHAKAQSVCRFVCACGNKPGIEASKQIEMTRIIAPNRHTRIKEGESDLCRVRQTLLLKYEKTTCPTAD